MADREDRKIYAYHMVEGDDFGTRDQDRDIDLGALNIRGAGGLWSDGDTLWVVDSNVDKILAFTLTEGDGFGTHDADKDIDVGAAGLEAPPRPLVEGWNIVGFGLAGRQGLRLQAEPGQPVRRPRPRQGHHAGGGE